MAQIETGTGTGDKLTVDATSKAARVTLYDALGNVSIIPNRSAVSDTVGGTLASGKDYKIARAFRASPDGTLPTSDDSLMLYDSVEGAAVDTNKWIQTTTTQTIAQATGAITFNSGSSVATTTGAMHVSHRFFPFIHRSAIAFRTRVRTTAHFANNQLQMGFGAPTGVTAVAVTNGAFWRKDGSGQWLPVIAINGTEILGAVISDATFRAAVPATDYAIFAVFLEETRATFHIQTSLGVLVTSQVVDFTAASTSFSATHIQAFHHCVNTGATGTAVQMLVSGTSVFATDAISQRPWNTTLTGMGYGALTSPTAYTQLANYANSAAPASATLANTTAGYTTLGGQFQWVAVAGAETDYALFAFTVPSPYTFYMTGIKLSTWNMGAAAAATPTLLQWGLGFNSSAVSLATGAPYTPMRQTIGSQQLVASAAIGISFAPDIIWTPPTPQPIHAGRIFHIILKSLVSAATASEIIRGVAMVDGYFE
jgi:hypothetical protein